MLADKPSRSVQWKLLLFLLPLCLLLSVDEVHVLSLTHLAGLRPTGFSLQRPSCPLTHLGEWGPFLDPCQLPILDAVGARLASPFTSHEGNGDIAHFLYSEPDMGAFFFDAAGPVCLVRAFFAAGFGSLGSDDSSPNVHLARLRVEVDGSVVLNASIAELFLGRPWAGTSSFSPLYAAAAAASSSVPSEAAYPGLPATHTFALERRPGGSLHSGWLLQAPICAHHRLRAAMIYPGFKQHFWSPDLLLHESVKCTATYEKCPVAQYFNVNARHFPGTRLPEGWAPFSPTRPPPMLPGSTGSSSSPRALWSAARVLLQAQRAAEAAGGVTATQGTLTRGSATGLLLYLSPPGSGAGVVTSLTLDFPTARQLLHARGVRLRALWDVGLQEGLARLAAGRAARQAEAQAQPQPAGMPEPFTARGWADGEEAAGAGAEAAEEQLQTGGVLEVDLESLLGPLRMGQEGARCFMPQAASTHNCRKELYLLGERPEGAEEGDGQGGLYITLPMPFWHSARIELFWDAAPSPPSADQASGEGAAPPTVPVAAAVTVSRATPYPPGTAGYLQGSVRHFAMAEGMRGNVLAGERGVRGSLAYLSVHVLAHSQNFVEGDLRVWCDGSPSPSVWESGWEDFFNGSHGYDEDTHHCGEALFAYDRVDPVGWGCYNNTDTHVHFYQARLLVGDAVAFAHAFRVAVEGLPRGKSSGQVTSAALWYGASAPPLLTTDWVHPPALWGTPGAAAHFLLTDTSQLPAAAAAALDDPAGPYTVAAPTGGLTTYNLHSGLPSYGEWRTIELLKCFKKGHCTHEGAGGGVAIELPGTLSLSQGAWVAFTLRLRPDCQRVLLRRLVDVRYSPQRALLHVDGVRVGQLSSSDRDVLHVHSSWKVDSLALPVEATAGKAAVRVKLQVLREEVRGRAYADYTSVNAEEGGHWTEARWEAVCVPHMPGSSSS